MRRLNHPMMIVMASILIFLAVQPSFFCGVRVNADAAMANHLIANPQDMPFNEEYRLGLADSPLYRFRAGQKLIRQGDKFVVERWKDIQLGWKSWVLLTTGLLLVWVWFLSRSFEPDPIPSTND